MENEQMSSYETLQIDCENWKKRGDELYDQVQELNKELSHSTKEYHTLADRLRKSQKDNERLCKILIENNLGDLIEEE